MIIELRDIGNTIVDMNNVSMIRGRQEYCHLPCANFFEIAIGFDKIICKYKYCDGNDEEMQANYCIYLEDYNKIKKALLAKYDQDDKRWIK